MKMLNIIVQKVLIILMMVMTADVLWGVCTRYIMGNQASWSEELARFLLVWIGLLGAAYASGKRMHLSIDLLSDNLSARGKRRLQFFIAVIIILFASCVMVIGGARLIYIVGKLGQHSPALGIPMELVYAVLPISGLLIVFYKIRELFLITPETI